MKVTVNPIRGPARQGAGRDHRMRALWAGRRAWVSPRAAERAPTPCRGPARQGAGRDHRLRALWAGRMAWGRPVPPSGRLPLRGPARRGRAAGRTASVGASVMHRHHRPTGHVCIVRSVVQGMAGYMPPSRSMQSIPPMLCRPRGLCPPIDIDAIDPGGIK